MSVPRLLVSVRNVEEAGAALRGGCQILDIKEPRAGSLGMASEATLHAIAQFVKQDHPEITLTAALGEVHEFQPNGMKSLPQEFDLVKLGCARLGQDPSWQEKWHAVRDAWSDRLTTQTRWVAVAYADWQLAEAPRPDQVISAALATNCQGVLFDTHNKSSRRLLDWISVRELQAVTEKVHSAGLFLALAGSLRSSDLPRLSVVPADIIAIRGAACRSGNRVAEIDETAVSKFREAIHQGASVKPSSPDSSRSQSLH